MDFDKNNVYDGLNATEELIGLKGYFEDTIRDLKDAVENERGFYLSELKCITKSSYPFKYKKGGSSAALFYPIEKVEKYRPYTYEELENLLGRSFRKENASLAELLYLIQRQEDGEIVINGFMTVQQFLEDCQWINEEKCGMSIMQGVKK